MKILIVNTNSTKIDGITNVIFNLLENIDRHEIDFGYVSINSPSQEFVERLNVLNCKLYVIPRKISKILEYIKCLSVIAREYDVIHVHGNSATMAIELSAAKLGGVKYRIAHSHNTKCKMVLADKLLRPLFYKLCNRRLACGKEAGKWLFGNRHFEIIQNGVNTSRFRFDICKRNALRNSKGWQDKIVIGHVGNFVEAKNHRFIFEIIKSAICKNDNIRLVCVGNGRLMESSRNYVESLNLNDFIYFVGSVNNPEDYVSAMDLILMPSIHEGLPLTLVEEQSNGLQCLVSDAITSEADLTGCLHFLSLNDPIEKWGDKLLELAARKVEDRTLISYRNIERIKEKGYDISTEAKKLSDFYRNLTVRQTTLE